MCVSRCIQKYHLCTCVPIITQIFHQNFLKTTQINQNKYSLYTKSKCKYPLYIIVHKYVKICLRFTAKNHIKIDIKNFMAAT